MPISEMTARGMSVSTMSTMCIMAGMDSQNSSG